MYDLNQVTMTGRLTRDPELKYLESGYSLCNFSLAVNRGKKKDSEEEYPAYFFNCVAWGKTAENISKYFSKGRKILITGQLEHQTWVDDSGGKRSTVKINVRGFQFMGGNKGDAENGKTDKDTSKSDGELKEDEEYFKALSKGEEPEKEGFDLGDDVSMNDDEIPF